MNTDDIRRCFIDFFEAKGHTVVPSSPLVPAGDPTLLFTNSGMVQFKDVLLGVEERRYQRAVSAQRCLRAGGKHNDLENVGYTARHHTFFEMLGNFSFGDYFKRDAIRLAWQLLTEGYRLPAEKLWVTVYQEDDEAYDLWKHMVGVDAEKIIRIGDNKGARYASDNFWQMADIGPCGPCSEIFYDHGETIPGGPPGSAEAEGDRYIEIWNLVFMQFNRDEHGVLHPLPKPSVDTGMGLERIATVLQGLHSNYDIDIFQRLIQAAAYETECTDLSSPSLKVLADHIRACSFMIVDGIIPGNEGRSYVLRRIIRRAIRHGYKLGVRKPFFHRLVDSLNAEMGEAYPELQQAQTRVVAILQQEESRFFSTIEHGMAILEGEMLSLSSQKPAVLDGGVAFKLHDTYGFPLDLTADVCRERHIQVDELGFDEAMAKQKMKARAAGKFKASITLEYQGEKNLFQGYQRLNNEAKVLALYCNGVTVSQLNEGEEGVVVLDQTAFYAESGGQVGDQGKLQSASGIFSVADTQKIQPDVFGHYGMMTIGCLSVGDTLQASVDESRRMQTMRHHSATHLMHRALRQVLGDHVQQKGSQVDCEKTRFDFSHSKPVSAEELLLVEQHVNSEILRNDSTEAQVMSLQAAKQSGAMMLFDEKYAEEVRVLTIGSSQELCGGTHVERTGDIGLFKIIDESGVAAGVRRVEAVTGTLALKVIQEQDQTLGTLARVLKSSRTNIANKVEVLQNEQSRLQREIRDFQQKALRQQATMLHQEIKQLKNLQCLIQELPAMEIDSMRGLIDALRDDFRTQAAEFAVVLGSPQSDKAMLMIGLSQGLSKKVKAGDIARMAAVILGGKGGGRADFAQAGGRAVEKLQEALRAAESMILQTQ